MTTASTPSRRSVAKGVAWTVPAVTIAASAPALAASPTDPTPVCTFGEGNVTVRLEDTATTDIRSNEIWRVDYSVAPDAVLPKMTWVIEAQEVWTRATDAPGECPEGLRDRDADSRALFTYGPLTCTQVPAENDQQGGGLSRFSVTVTLNPLTPNERQAADLRLDDDWSVFQLIWPARNGIFGNTRSRWMYSIRLQEVTLPGSSAPCPGEQFVDGNPGDHLATPRWLRQQANEPKWDYYDAGDAARMGGDTGGGNENEPMKYLPFGSVPSTFNNREDV